MGSTTVATLLRTPSSPRGPLYTRCAAAVHRTLYTLFSLHAKYPRLTVTPSKEINKKKGPSISLRLFLSSRSSARARVAPRKFLPLGLLLHSALFAPIVRSFADSSYRGFSFYASHFLLPVNFVFLSCPARPPSRPRRLETTRFAVLPYLLSLFSPFLLLHPGTQSRGGWGDYATHNGEI